MSEIVKNDFETLFNYVPEERREQSAAYWADRSLKTVVGEMPSIERYEGADIAVVQPEGEVDETKTILLPLEFNQGITPAHYMRAKVLQQYLAPESRVVIVPNSSADDSHVDMSLLSEYSKKRMSEGDYMPYASLLHRSVAEADVRHNFGTMAIVASSQGALTGLAFATSEMVPVSNVLAHETPSKSGRSAKQLGKDFNKSGGGVFGLKNAIADSEVRAQRQAMRFPDRYTRDIVKFAKRSMTHPDAKLLAEAMSGSAEYLASPATKNLGMYAVVFSYAKGSLVFDPESISDETKALAPVIELTGERLEKQAHATSNNLRLLAALAYNSFNS